MSKKIIVTITESQVVAEHVDPSAEDPIVSRAVVAWNAGDLSTALHQSLEDYSDTKQIKMMLTESLYHLTGFVVDKKHAGDRKYIKQKASELFLVNVPSRPDRWEKCIYTSFLSHKSI